MRSETSVGEGWYDRHVLPHLLDIACGMKPIRRQREKIVPRARGRVLEVGIGTGLNMRHYDKSKVSAIVGIDPALGLHPMAARRIARSGLAVELVGLSAEKIPIEDAAFDTVVVTYTLCTIPDPVAALREMGRLLKPGGQLLFCEHGLAPDAAVRRWQERLDPYWGPLAGGCHLARDIPALLAEAGFRIEELDAAYLPGPRPLTFNYRGTARRGEPRLPVDPAQGPVRGDG